ncbi:MAG: membrane protein insertion efficiency factor YidD [Candidatus Uhrbacteria bacterium]|nr:membrane protein insertion efficiency factor YidD [Candidatus Uhrbacteria bacterium]
MKKGYGFQVTGYRLVKLPRRVGQLLIVIYQRTISLDHGPLAKFVPFRICRYHPTCSEYGYEAIGIFGLFRGSWLTLKRICRCHPWSTGGHDPVPER